MTQPRAEPPCPHAPNCIGCPLIGKPYGEQLACKRELLAAALREHTELGHLDVPEVVGSPRTFGYRNQAKLVVRSARRGLLLGIYRPGTHQVVDIRECPVHHPKIGEALEAVAATVERLGIPAYDERTRHGSLRYVIVRVGIWNKSLQVILVTATRSLPRAKEVVKALRRVRGLASVVHNINDDPGNVILGDEFSVLTKEDSLTEKIGGLKLLTRAGAFLQANPNIAGRIYRQATEWAEVAEGDAVIDLFCGAGALTFSLAEKARLVVGIEASPIAVIDAKRNARLNGFHNTRFHAGDAGEQFRLLSEALQPRVVALNPPRKGAGEAVRQAIVAAGPERIVYVSCDPRTLARDLAWFDAHGYRADQVRAFDMMPQTEHVESVARLSRVQ